jgi:hypothetical protein
MTAEPKLQTIIFPLLLFAISMAFLEVYIVLYIRDLYYPEGFAFPLKAFPRWLLVTEMAREVCTLIMLGTVAWISGKSPVRRLSAFLFIFGTWDIFYYLGPWLSIGWPESLLTWNILFLIPVVWAGPVLAPVMCSLLMISMAAYFERCYKKRKMNSFQLPGLILFIAGASVIFISFIYDYALIVLKSNYIQDLLKLAGNTTFKKDLTSFIPDRFQWELFGFGMLLILTGAFFAVDKIKLIKARH